jgi:hypothetical protein
LDAPAGVAKIAFAGQLGWLTSTLDGSLIYLAPFILSRKYAALIMKSTPGLMKRQCRSGSERTHFGIMWVIFDHLRPSGHIMADHVGDRGAAHLDPGASQSATYQACE